MGTVLTITPVNDSPSKTLEETNNEETIVPSATAGVIGIEAKIMNQYKIASMAENMIETVGMSPEETEEVEQNIDTVLNPDSILSAVYADPNADEDAETPLITVQTEYEAYVSSASSINVRSTPDTSTDDNKVDTIYGGETITVVGEVISTETEFSKIEYTDEDGNITDAYVSSEYITEKLDESETYNDDWTGKTLNRHSGYTYGPNGKETYYNLNMSRCIKYMNDLGYYGEYWVRNDGVKMFGNNIMVAANLSKYPKGTLVETSLGTGIVVDTGDFCHNGSGVAFDIAVAW
jgi:hypothetical protein